MKKYLSSFLLVVLCFTAITAGVASAASARKVYLKDGAVIECKKAWRSGGKIMVLVNRDVLLDFPTAEVDLKKTFTKKGVGAKGKKKHLKKTSKQVSTGKTAFLPRQKPILSAKKVATPAKQALPAPPAKPATVLPATPPVAKNTALPVPAASKPATLPVTVKVQAAPSSAKVAAAAPQPPKPAPRPAIKFVPPPPPPPEPFYKNPLVLQLGGGGLLIFLLLILLVMRKKKA